MRPIVLLALSCTLILGACRAPLVLGHRGPVVAAAATAAPEDRTPGAELSTGDVLCTRWQCGPEWGRLWRRWQLELEAGPLWQSRNDVGLPGDTGTRFALDDVTGSGAFPYGRVTLDYRVRPRHTLRALVAPLEIRETGTLPQAVSFRGASFAAGTSTEATYRFNSYRLTYRYLLGCGCDWSLEVGLTAKVRDARIALRQGALKRTKYDLGFVPLLHVAYEKRLAPRWRFVGDLDFAWAPQGRAIDLAAKLFYDVDDRWSIGLGYRTIEGGADNDTVYTFSWLHQALVSVSYRF